MSTRLTKFLQLGTVLIGIAVLSFLLWEPHLEGRNARVTVFQIYFEDPFLMYVYLASTPFFIEVYQVFRVWGKSGQEAVRRLRTIKYCAISLIGLVVIGELFLLMGHSDDRAGGVFMGLLITVASVVIAASAARFERILQN